MVAKEIFSTLKFFTNVKMLYLFSGLRIKETKEVYEGEVTELSPVETENPMGGKTNTFSSTSFTALQKLEAQLFLIFWDLKLRSVCRLREDR